MKKVFMKIQVAVVALFLTTNLSFAEYNVQFYQTYGGPGFDRFNMQKQLPNGEFIACGFTTSMGAGGDDGYIVRMDEAGNMLQQKTIGGTGTDLFRDFELLPDGGFIFGGYTTSYGRGSNDFWMVRTDANLDTLWTKTFGSTDSDILLSILVCADGGFFLTGNTHGEINGVNGAASDHYVVKTDALGNMEWERAYWEYGGDGEIHDAVENEDGTFTLFGWGQPAKRWSNSLLKIEALGNPIWVKNYTDLGRQSKLKKYGNKYLMIGFVRNRSSANLMTADEDGNEITRGYYGGLNNEWGVDAIQTPDKGFLLVGETTSYGVGGDVYVLKVDSNLIQEWDTTFGGIGEEWAQSIVATRDGGYAISGLTSSYGAGGYDALFLKLAPLAPLNTKAFITGKVYLDKDSNNVYNAGDLPLVNSWVKAGLYQTLTDTSGNYEFKVEPGTYTVAPNSAAPWKNYTHSPNNCSVTVKAGESKHCSDFGYAIPLSLACDDPATLQITASPQINFEECNGRNLITPCKDQLFKWCFTLTNSTDDLMHAADIRNVIQTTPNPIGGMTWISDDFGLSPKIAFTSTGGAGRRNYDLTGNLIPGASTTFCITYLITNEAANRKFDARFTQGCGALGPVTPASININAMLDLPSQDGNGGCACDPNDLQVYPVGCGNGGNILYTDSTELTYYIRFENIGTGPAKDIVISDTLDLDLDFSTIQILESSHPITRTQIDSGNALNFTFENINLASIDYPELNKGFVQFTAKPKTGLADGTEINNVAAIYFDTNHPEVTNTVLNTLRYDLTLSPNFTVARNCNSTNATYNFTYTGAGTGVTYLWDFGGFASSEVQNPSGIVFPATGTYNVTLTINKYGCTESITKNISVIDYSFDNKVSVCHSTGNGNKQTIIVNKNALQAHLNHGDCIGACEAPIINARKGFVLENFDEISAPQISQIKLYPNPTSNTITIDVSEFVNNEAISFLFTDMYGKKIDSENNISSNHQLDLSNLSGGIYLLSITINGETKTHKIIKN